MRRGREVTWSGTWASHPNATTGALLACGLVAGAMKVFIWKQDSVAKVTQRSKVP